VPSINNLVLTIGTFDGVHLGHRRLIARITTLAKAHSGAGGIITFHPHPRTVLPSPKNPIRLLTTIEERAALLAKLQLDYLFVVPFSQQFAHMPAADFIEAFIVKKFRPKTIVIGFNHRFGHNREGDVTLLRTLSKKHQYSVEQIGEQMLEEITFSSTKIRQLLETGKVEEASKLLGYTYNITGEVVAGDKQGRKLGFPTANIHVARNEKLIPQKGVYAVKVNVLGGFYHGMANIGNRPTFGGETRRVEVHLFDFDSMIYGEQITMHFITHLRDEKRFPGGEALKNQLQHDKQNAIKVIFKK